MDIKEMRGLIRDIEQAAKYQDDEMAHRLEKQAWARALRAAAHSQPESWCLCALALTTLDIKFSRWFA